MAVFSFFKRIFGDIGMSITTNRVLKDWLLEERKKMIVEEKRIENLTAEYKKLKAEYNAIKSTSDFLKKSEEQQELEKILKMWLRNLIDDFTNYPFKDKFSKNWGLINKFGNINWSYRFEDNFRVWNILSNDNITNVTSVLMSDGETKISIAITDALSAEIFKILEPMLGLAKKRPVDFAKLDIVELRKNLDTALEERNFEAASLIKKAIDDKSQNNKS
jgi:hypothetical protein